VAACLFDDESHEAFSRSIATQVMTRRFPPVVFIDLFLTESCNFACPYCFVEGKQDRHMSWEVATAAVEFLLRESREQDKVEMLLFGGEPLLCFDMMKRLVPYGYRRAREEGKALTFSMTTNGSLVNHENLAFMRDHGIKFLLSVDGDEEMHNAQRRYADGSGTWDDVAGRIQLMKSYQPWMGARVTPSPDNVHRLFESVRTLHWMGINQFIIGPASGIVWPHDKIEEYSRQMIEVGEFYVQKRKARAYFRLTLFEDSLDSGPGSKRGIWGCGAGRGRISVSVDGELQGCGKIQGMDGLKGFLSLGNVFDGFTDLEARAQLTHMGYEKRPRCQKCDLQNDCAGGCPAVNWQMTGSIFECHPVDCKFTRAILGVKDYIQGRLKEEGLKTESQEACERADKTKAAAVESQGADDGEARG